MKKYEEEIKLIPCDERFPYPQTLRRSLTEGFDGTERDETSISAAEGDADGDAHEFAALRLSPDMNVVFDGKKSLKRRRPLSRIVLPGIAAAAVALALYLIFAGEETLRQPEPYVSAAAETDEKGRQKEQLPIREQEQQRTAVTGTPSETASGKAKETEVKAAAAMEAPQHTMPSTVGEPETSSEIARTQIPPESYEPQKTTLPALSGAIVCDMDPVAMQSAVLPVDVIAEAVRNIREEPKNKELTEYPGKAGRIVIGAVLHLLKRPAPSSPLQNTAFLVDRTAGSGIIAINILLGRSATEIRQYDSEGNLISYAVESPTLNMHRTYNRE